MPATGSIASTAAASSSGESTESGAATAPGLGSGLTFGNYVGRELYSLTAVCGFIQQNGTGYGICKSCRLGALGGSKSKN